MPRWACGGIVGEPHPNVVDSLGRIVWLGCDHRMLPFLVVLLHGHDDRLDFDFDHADAAPLLVILHY